MNKKRFFFPMHYDGGNRGCEAIAKGTAQLLSADKNCMLGYCMNIDLDRKLGLEKYYTLIPYRIPTTLYKIKYRLFNLFHKNPDARRNFTYSYYYDDFLKLMNPEDIMLSTGGDMFCYENCEVNYTVNYLAARNKKTVLWGCSIGKNNLTPEKIEALHNFTAVVARESLTKELFDNLGLKKVYLIPDPAFILEPEPCSLPNYMNTGDFVAINLSNFVGKDVGKGSLLGQNIRNMIKYILNETTLNILFIPHVMWENQDDKTVCSSLIEELDNPDRLYMLDSENYNYCQIRYIISMCKLCIAARTHAAISAYSTCVPTLALGYSVKSKGIAKDLGLPDSTVVDIVGVKNPNEMKDAFVGFHSMADEIREHLQRVIPEYKLKLNAAKKIFSEL